MVLISRASEADFTFIPGEYSDEIRVLRFSGVEEISRPFYYRLKLAALDFEIDFGDIIGKTAYLRVNNESGERYVHGIITKFIQAGSTNRYTIYHAELVPIEWLLSMRYNSRIFQQKSVQEIITDVFSGIELQSDQYRFALQGNHPTREFCVQYRESDLNFISRLMEEEGIFYFFEHDDEKHVIVMADDPSVHVAVDSPNIPFNPASGMVAEQEYIYSFRFIQQIRPNITVLRDFNYEDPFPAVNLMGLDSGTDYIPTWFTDQELEFYDYPGGFMDRDRGDDIAQIRLQSLRQNVQVATGSSVCRRLIPGYKFTLEGHSRPNFNQEYMITRVETSGSQPLGEDSIGDGQTYNNNFECIPASVTYRPPRRTPKPIVEGVQTAIVVGPSGSDIYTDDLGRVKVEFHWDRDESQADENRSCWVRVSHGYAGEKHGIQFTPLINDEVIVDFLEGDPDRPIITGRVYNFVNFPHLNSSDTVQNLILTPYQHRLLLDDKKASITLNTGGGQNLIMTDGSKESIDNISLYTSGNHKMIMSDGAQKIEIRSTGNYYMEFDDKNQVINVQSAGGHNLDLDDAKKRIGMVTASGHQFTMNDENNFILHKTVAGSYIGMSDQKQRTDLKTSGGHHIRMSDAEGYIKIETSGGHKVLLDDQYQNIEITSSGGRKILISDAQGVISMTSAGTSQQIYLDEQGNEAGIYAPAATVKINALNIEITAKASLKLSGTTTEVKGTASNQIKGGTIQMGPPT